ncbi:DUF2507 domain-containing protein [Alkalicoccus luteus]|uniref:DUF2507 domain-containing protein n=1 Tax=Alkalicoccus luteus TaxID=1237094 RepID=A0A969TU55_9BACI|nr:DUF2507 domain-containing protein [Alkalicoccus luteus]NJP36712.1 DUF2507 domain-containing protein [Alkalicoccus luteus]
MSEEQQQAETAAGYDVMRHELLPIILGEDEEVILYWAGKSLAREKKTTDEEALVRWFRTAQWGNLRLIKEKRAERIYEVTTSSYEPKRPYSLETGFLAQITELEKGLLAEANYEIKKKKPVTFHVTVKWDKKDPTAPGSDD